MKTLNWGISGLNVVIVFLALLLNSCIEAPTIDRRKTFVQTQPNDPQGAESSVDPEDNQDESLPEEDLPPYLFKLSEAMAISEIVEVYIPTSFDMFADATAATNREEMRTFFQNFLGSMMMLQGLNPGRDLDVMVSDNSVPNASALGQQIMINEGMITIAKSESLLGVICHEIAHSSKNHSQKSEADQVFSGLDTFLQSNEFIAYMEAAYDGTTYSHSKTEYDALRKTWDEVAKEPSLYSRRHESEADIVGGMICAHLGMSADEFYQNQLELRQALSAAGAGQSANNIADGTQIPIPQDEIQDFVRFLFPLNSHPTGKERDAQLMRTKSAIQKYFDEDSTMSTEFSNQMSTLNPALGLVGRKPVKLPFWYKATCSHGVYRY